jgi:hypothetical protein
VSWAVAPAAAAGTRTLIEQALDESTHITLDNVTLVEAIGVLSGQTGVKIVMPPEAMQLLPDGPNTQLSKVEIAGVSLRQGLTELFGPLGMTLELRDDHVEIAPKNALRCLSRAATWAELDTLAELSAMPTGVDADAIDGLRPRIQFHVSVPGAWQLLSQAVRNVGAGAGDEVLTVACRQLGWGWCLSGDRIVIEPMQEQVLRRLHQPISLRMNNRPLFDVLKAVGREAGVEVRLEPGALADLPLAVQRNFSLNVYQQSAEEALETTAAYTGLGFYIQPDGVIFYSAPRREETGGGQAETDARATPAPAPRDPYVAKLSVPIEGGASMEWLIRASELPDDLRDMRQRDLENMIERLRRQPAGE